MILPWPSRPSPRSAGVHSAVMRYLLLFAAAVAWALWLGGTIATFVFGLYYFHHLPAEQFAAAARAMFAAFVRYQLGLAAAALLASGLAMVTYPSRWTLGMVAAFLFAGITAIVFGLVLVPQMEILRRQAGPQSAEFMRVHGQSMVTMSVQAVILLAAGAALVGAAARRPKPARSFVPGRGFEPVPVA